MTATEIEVNKIPTGSMRIGWNKPFPRECEWNEDDISGMGTMEMSLFP